MDEKGPRLLPGNYFCVFYTQIKKKYLFHVILYVDITESFVHWCHLLINVI